MTLDRQHVYLIGSASGIGGPDPKGGAGPLILQQSPYLKELEKKNLQLQWKTIITPDLHLSNKLDRITKQCQLIAQAVLESIHAKQFFITTGGDHSCAIGTWSGAKHALKAEDDLGLIWIDAHMDSHTPQTTLTGNVHGMPLASLLGHGEKQLTHLLTPSAKLKPENLCLIGIRSFEGAEQDLLEQLNVKIFYMNEVKSRGIAAVMQEAIHHVSQHTKAFGVSIDIDSMDPKDAPGTDVAEPDGIRANELCQALTLLAHNSQFIGAEIAEFDPHRDKEHVTEKIIAHMISAITLGK